MISNNLSNGIQMGSFVSDQSDEKEFVDYQEQPKPTPFMKSLGVKLVISVQTIRKNVPLLKEFSPSHVLINQNDGSVLRLTFLDKKVTSFKESYDQGRTTFQFSNLDVMIVHVLSEDVEKLVILNSQEDVHALFNDTGVDHITLVDENGQGFEGLLSVSFAALYLNGEWTQLNPSSSGLPIHKWTDWTVGHIDSLSRSEIEEINEYLTEHLSFYVENKVSTSYYLSICMLKSELAFDQEYCDQFDLPGEDYLLFHPNYRRYLAPLTFREFIPVPFLLKEGDDSDVIFGHVVSCLREDGFPKEKTDIYVSLQRAAELYAHRET